MARWMRWVALLYVVLITGALFATIRSPWSAVATLPITVGYFALWVPVLRHVHRRVRALDGNVCYECGYEMDATVGTVCTECGHEQTVKNRDMIHLVLRGWRWSR